MSNADGAAPPAKKGDDSAPAPASTEGRGPRRPRGEKTCYNCGKVSFNGVLGVAFFSFRPVLFRFRRTTNGYIDTPASPLPHTNQSRVTLPGTAKTLV